MDGGQCFVITATEGYFYAYFCVDCDLVMAVCIWINHQSATFAAAAASYSKLGQDFICKAEQSLVGFYSQDEMTLASSNITKTKRISPATTESIQVTTMNATLDPIFTTIYLSTTHTHTQIYMLFSHLLS